MPFGYIIYLGEHFLLLLEFGQLEAKLLGPSFQVFIRVIIDKRGYWFIQRILIILCKTVVLASHVFLLLHIFANIWYCLCLVF